MRATRENRVWRQGVTETLRGCSKASLFVYGSRRLISHCAHYRRFAPPVCAPPFTPWLALCQNHQLPLASFSARPVLPAAADVANAEQLRQGHAQAHPRRAPAVQRQVQEGADAAHAGVRGGERGGGGRGGWGTKCW